VCSKHVCSIWNIMAELRNIRSSIIAKVTEFRPTQDFPIPDALIDHMIFHKASELKYTDTQRKRGNEGVEPGEITRFTCLVASLETSECIPTTNCNSSYVLDLPFTPQSLPDGGGIVGVYIQNSMITIDRYSGNNFNDLGVGDIRPRYETPGYFLIGRRMYFVGGDRDFAECHILIDAAVEGIDPSGLTDSCTAQTINVPIPGYLVPDLEKQVVNEILNESKTDEEDSVPDGIPPQQ
ncbi:MAG: hypothetical protein ACQ5SW_00060, partial [Sphaerochaetaceae bacterium]